MPVKKTERLGFRMDKGQNNTHHLAEILARVDEAARGRGARAFVVGGVVRDLIARHDTAAFLQDIDVVIAGDAREVARTAAVAVEGRAEVFDRFFTAKIIRATFPYEIDLVSARRETYERPGALPTVSLGSLHDDLHRRDFTINAMALPLETVGGYLRGDVSEEQLEREVIDPLGGKEDLQARLVRILHTASFHDDPTRLFRALRYAARFQAMFCPQTEDAFQESLRKGNREIISANRVLQEVRKIILEERPNIPLALGVDKGLLTHFLGLDPGRARDLPGAFERLNPHRAWLTPVEWWHIAQWLLLWAGMERSPRIEAALERRRRDIETAYREIEAFSSADRRDLQSVAGFVARYGLTGTGLERLAELQAKRDGAKGEKQ